MKKIVLFAILIPWLFAASAQQTDIPEAVISNKLIKAKLYLPDFEKGYYRGTRFDWSGIIESLECNDHNFYGQWFEKYNPETHDAVMGPVDEFGPVGFDETEVGGSFLKIGVGILTRPDEKAYNSFRLYQISNPGKWKIKKYGNGIRFIHNLKDPVYSYLYEKNIQLVEGKPEMIISYTFKNRGSHAIETTSYNHNFPVIDNQPAGPGYVISFPFNLSGTGQGFGEVVSIQDNKLIYLRNQTVADRVYSGDLKGYGNKSDDYDITIENTNAGAGIRIRCDQPLYKLVYWSSPTTVCPEPYIRIIVKPGEEFTWEIRYEYYTIPSEV